MLRICCALPLSLFFSFLIYSNMRIGDWFGWQFVNFLWATLVIKFVIFGLLHQYQGWWRYVSVSDLLSIIKGSHFSTLLIILGWYAPDAVAVRSGGHETRRAGYGALMR